MQFSSIFINIHPFGKSGRNLPYTESLRQEKHKDFFSLPHFLFMNSFKFFIVEIINSINLVVFSTEKICFAPFGALRDF